MQVRFYDVQINVHPTNELGQRVLTIIFTEDAEKKVTRAGHTIEQQVSLLARAADKDLPLLESKLGGKCIICFADDADLAEEEAADLRDLLDSCAGLSATIVHSSGYRDIQLQN